MNANEIATLDSMETTIAEMDSVVNEVRPLILADDVSDMKRAIGVALGMERLEKLLTGPVMRALANLQGKKSGFLTDRKYSPDELRDPIIYAQLNGARIIGDEFNVIAGGAMLVKNFYKRALRELDGFANFKPVPGVPTISDSGALIPWSATWTMHGVPDSLACEKSESGDARIPIGFKLTAKGYYRESIDAVKGKAERRFLKLIYERVIGSTFSDVDPDDPLAIDATPDAVEYVENWREEFGLALERCSGINEVNAIEDHYLRIAGSEAEGAEINGRCDERREAIRATRGERSGK